MLRLEEEDIYAGIATSGGGGGDTPESAKGSFNASTQQLTLKYDYLVEKINSATWLTDEQKTTTIASLNESDISVVMNDSTLPENPYEYMFVGSENYGITMDITTPVTLKFLITPAYDTPAGFATIGTYKAIADFNTFLGTPMTEEEAEAQFAPFIVDENLCTVSGTLGNFSVKFIEDAPIVEKFGATISTFIGDVDSNGVLQAPSRETEIVFNGVKDVDSDALRSAFTNSGSTNFNIVSVSFPDLITISNANALVSMCQGNRILQSVSFPKLQTITGSASLQSAFYGCSNLSTVSLPELVSVTGRSSSVFNSTALTSISLPKLVQISDRKGTNGWESGFAYCASLNQINMPLLEKLGMSALSYGFSGCNALTSVVFPSLKIVFYQGLGNAFRNCQNLTSLSFPSLTSRFNFWEGNSYHRNESWSNMLYGVTGCTVHLPSNLESVVGNDTAVTTGFGGTNTTVLFDLPATE